MFEWGENYLSTGIYVFVLLFAALVITICFGPGPGKTFLTAEEKEKKKTQEGLTIVPPAQWSQNLQQQASAAAAAAAAASQSSKPSQPPTSFPAPSSSSSSNTANTTTAAIKPSSTSAPAPAPASAAANAPPPSSNTNYDTEISKIELPEKLKANMSQYIETVGQMKTELKKLQKVELLLIAKEIKELIDEMNNTENELNKLIQ